MTPKNPKKAAEGPRPMNVISLGAGVQSSAMALMAARGEIGPMPEAAVFADTQAEPEEVYQWLSWLKKKLPFPVFTVTRGNLGKDACLVKKSKKGNNYTGHTVPVFIKDKQGRVGLAMRQCTTDHKINVIYQKLDLIRKKREVIQWVGISFDERGRMKTARRAWVKNRYPLVDMFITRQGCLEWMAKNGYPTPPRSACVFCPFHNDKEWQRLKTEDHESFQSAVTFEMEYTNALHQVSGFRGTPFLHRSCVPLNQVDFRSSHEKYGQQNLWEDECEGMCGV